MKYQNTIIFIVILMLNLLFLLLINSIENSLNITYPTLIINEQEIMNNIFFYSLFLIIITPLIEEVLYRLPLIYNPLIIISFLIGFIYILILDWDIFNCYCFNSLFKVVNNNINYYIYIGFYCFSYR